MSRIRPWTKGPFELIVHAEQHFINGDDYDRRVAMIGFDNSIEVSITTYLSINPIQRGNRQYSQQDVGKWLRNYHTKLEFYYLELNSRKHSELFELADVLYYHDIRNRMYHGGNPGIPELENLENLRRAAIWIFSELFEVNEIDNLILNRIEEINAKPITPKSNLIFDQIIDNNYEPITIADQNYSLSEALFKIDRDAYYELGNDLINEDITNKLMNSGEE
jgi:hypothetical protein